MVKEIEMFHVDERKADHARFDDSERAKPEKSTEDSFAGQLIMDGRKKRRW